MNTTMLTSKSPSLFFLLIFALSVPLWAAGSTIGLDLLPGVPASSLAVTFCPMIAALILVYRTEKVRGVTGLLKRAFDYRRITAKRWYVPVVLLIPVVFVLSYGWMRLMGSPIPAPQFPLWTPVLMFVAFFIYALGEELGWMGYAVDPMQDRSNALQAGILLGVAWAAWHLVPVVQVGRSLEWIAWQCLFWLATRVLFVWLYNNTGKSVFAAAVFHSLLNVCSFLFPVNGSFYDPRITGLIVTGVAVIVIVLWGPKTLARFRFTRLVGALHKEQSQSS